MSLFMPEHPTADLDMPARNQMLAELITEELNNIPETWSPQLIESYLKRTIIDKFNINHPEYNASISYDVTPTGTHITAWVTRRLALVKLTLKEQDKEKCKKTLIQKLFSLLTSFTK